MPPCASPATESPAITATAIGRNSGSTIARAATENSCPLASTADRNAGPVPGRGARFVAASSTATSVGSAFSSTRVSHVRGRRASLISSTADHGASTRSAGDRAGQHDLLEGVPLHRQPVHRHPGVDETTR